MAVKNNQLEVPFTPADKAKLDGVDSGAKTYSIASQAEAEAGLDNVKLMTPLRVSQAIAEQGGGGGGDSSAVKGFYLNNSGLILSELTVVRQDISGNITKIDPTVEDDIKNILGLLLTTTSSGSTGSVALAGLVKNITTVFGVSNIIYLSKTGGLTTTVPEIGTGGFVVGDWVVKVGKITKNSSNPSARDFKLEFNVVGQL